MNDFRAPFEALGVAFTGVGAGATAVASCLFHADIPQSLTVNLETGHWQCTSCHRTGTAEAFERFVQEQELPTRDIPETEYLDRANDLAEDPDLVAQVEKITGISGLTMTLFRLGWQDGRLTVPIIERSKCVNLRRFALEPRSPIGKVVDYSSQHVGMRLWPRSALSREDVWIASDELEAILLTQLGLSALAVTGPLHRWRSKWTDLFAGKKVKICLGRGVDGDVAANRLATTLAPVATEVRVLSLRLPAGDTVRAAVTKHSWGAPDFLRLAMTAGPRVIPNLPGSVPLKAEPPVEVTLHRASQGDLVGKQVRVRVVVAGKDLAPFAVPREVDLTCGGGLKICGSCPIADREGRLPVRFDAEDPVLLKLIQCSSSEQQRVIGARANIPGQCVRFQMMVQNYHNLEEINIMPELDGATDSAGEYVTRKAYFVGDGTKTNQAYEAEGTVLPHPQNQYVTFLFPRLRPVQASFSSYKTDDDSRKRLEIFQPQKNESPLNKMEEIAGHLEDHVTRLKQRKDLIIAFDLVAHSILGFDFQGHPLARGWVEGLIMGDTRCGKSENAQSLVKHYRLGEIVTGENVSYSGLVGGMQQTQKRWSISWGKWPLNDGRFLVFEEVSGLPVEDIGRLSGLRSSGIAEITKIQTERTLARCRSLWQANPRSKRPISSYASGSEAIRELIGRPEDVARFDFAQLVTTRDVPLAVINAPRVEPTDSLVYTSDRCHELLLWAWSRRRDHVIFTDGATQACLDHAGTLSRYYGGDLPLVEPNEQRVKLARMAAAMAARLFSTEDGEHLIVKPEHVVSVVDLLQRWYDHPAFDYRASTSQRRRELELPEPSAMMISRRLAELPRGTIEHLLGTQCLTRGDLQDLTGLDLLGSQQLLSSLVRAGALQKRGGYYVKSPGFISFLRSERQGGLI